MVYQRQEDWGRAEQYLCQATRWDPAHAQAHFVLGNLYLRQGKKNEGEEELARFQELKALGQELEALQKKVEAEPERPELRLEVAKLHQKLGKLDRAENELRLLLARSPDWTEARELLEQIRRAPR
jgi:Tfp pilus assembly protein PilF